MNTSKDKQISIRGRQLCNYPYVQRHTQKQLSFLTYINCTISEMHGISLLDLLSTFVFSAASAITQL